MIRSSKITKLAVALLVLITTTAVPTLAEVTFSGKAAGALNSMALFRGKDTMPTSDYQVVTAFGAKMKGAGPGAFTVDFINKYTDEHKIQRQDVKFAYNFSVLDKKLDLSFGNVSYLKSNVTKENTNEAFIAAKWKTFLNPTLTAYYDYDQAKGDGIFATLQGSKNFKFTDSLSVVATGLVSYNQESDALVGNYTDFHNAELQLAAKWKVTKQLTIIPSVTGSTPLSDDAEDIGKIDDEVKYGIKMAINF